MFSSMSMGQKAGSGLTSAIMGGILSAAYFDGTKATAAEQSAEAIRVIKGFYLYVPVAIWVVMFVIAACYQLDTERIRRRKRFCTGRDPVHASTGSFRKQDQCSDWKTVRQQRKKNRGGCCKSAGLQGL